MKNNLFLLLLIITSISIAQEKSIYFPQEEIIIKDCINASNKSECLNNLLAEKTVEFLRLEKSLKAIKKFKKDTLKISFHLMVSENGKILENESNAGTNSKKLNKVFKPDMENILFNLPIVEILNKKHDSLNSYHLLSYQYKINREKKKDVQLKPVDNKKTYSGGVIDEIPIYPGCENLSELKVRKCFNKKIKEHIQYHFKYPEKALKQKLSGRVDIVFNISKNGEISNIRTRGPHQLLKDEAIRIMSLLPNLKPGLRNGEPVMFPYSVPITFNL